jgi:fructokinase
MDAKSTYLVICFGEILWDNLPTGRNPGGAPMNVAYHLNKLGIPGALISAVGADDAGKDLLNFLKSKGVSSELVQVDVQHETSEVIATMNDEHEVSYEILTGVAWDYISKKKINIQAVSKASAFVYGSLSARSAESREALLYSLEQATYKVFDVNLRAPHYAPELILSLMHHADLLKVNAAELHAIAGWLNIKSEQEAEIIAEIFSKYQVQEVVVTKGGSGASLYTREKSYQAKAYQVDVQDTIGSGDSFLAALLAMKLKAAEPEVALQTAVAMGAFITSKPGACPDYDQREFYTFMRDASSR